MYPDTLLIILKNSFTNKQFYTVKQIFKFVHLRAGRLFSLYRNLHIIIAIR